MISCFFGLLAAWFSIGYFHLDEHYQILEFLSFKLGTGELKNLPWEYKAQIRPWIQPFFYFVTTKFFNAVGVDSPYILERVFRLISVILFQISIWRLTFYSIEKFKLEEKLSQFLIFSSSVFWAFPFLSARISSEGVGGSLFFIGLIGVLKVIEQTEQGDKEINILSLFLNSLIIGLSVWVRFQLGAAVLGFLIWYILFSKRFLMKSFVFIAFGGIVAAALGTLIDYWGYGEFVITPLKYFSRNIVEGEAARHGVTPWWEYFYISQKKLHPGFGLFVVICFIYQWVRNIKDVFSFSIFIFFLMHVGTAHKELRFIYPMAMLIPLYMTLFLKQTGINKKFSSKLAKPAAMTLLAYFFVGSIISSSRVQYQGVEAIKYLQDHNIEKAYYFSGIPLKNMTHDIEQSYYGKNITQEIGVKSFDQINENTSYFVSGRGGKQALLFQDQKCKEVFPRDNSLYFWLHYSRKFYKQDFYSIYLCN